MGIEAATKRALALMKDGADIIDIGGESTRPGSDPVPIDSEIERTIPVIKSILDRRPDTQISIDTRNSKTARQALDSGALMINDISGLRHDANMLNVLRDYPESKVIIMHMKGEPKTMQDDPSYYDVVKEINNFFEERIAHCVSNGIASDRLLLDPGIGFGKSLHHNLQILSNLTAFKRWGLPVVLGASRKRFISQIDSSNPDERIGGSLAAVNFAVCAGLDMVRVHDVKATRQFLDVYHAVTSMEEQ